MSEVKKVNLSAPWETYVKKLKALFNGDPDIYVGNLMDADDFVVNISVKNHKKFLALSKLLKTEVAFGNVNLHICLYDLENETMDKFDPIAGFTEVFSKNPNLAVIREITDIAGARHGFVCFKPEVIQFFNDNLNDYYGNWNGLAQDIASEVFRSDLGGIHFCTETSEK